MDLGFTKLHLVDSVYIEQHTICLWVLDNGKWIQAEIIGIWENMLQKKYPDYDGCRKSSM